MFERNADSNQAGGLESTDDDGLDTHDASSSQSGDYDEDDDDDDDGFTPLGPRDPFAGDLSAFSCIDEVGRSCSRLPSILIHR